MASSLNTAPAAGPQVSAAAVAASSSTHRRAAAVSFPLSSKTKRPQLVIPARGTELCRERFVTAKAQLNEFVGGPANDAASSKTNLQVSASKVQNVKEGNPSLRSVPLTEEAIAEFMSQVASLVKLVDSKDIVELQLKQNDCELIIRKKEALPQPPPAPVVMMQAPAPHPSIPSVVPQPSAAPALPPPSSAPRAPASPPKASKSSHPPLKSPMAGTFYRSPGPSMPAFVKPGDRVNKGQVLCIIEAMKLMNEIEADQGGTIVEILVEDGKPVGIDQPIFVIEP